MNVRGMLINSEWPWGGAAVFLGMILVMLVELWIFTARVGFSRNIALLSMAVIFPLACSYRNSVICSS